MSSAWHRGIQVCHNCLDVNSKPGWAAFANFSWLHSWASEEVQDGWISMGRRARNYPNAWREETVFNVFSSALEQEYYRQKCIGHFWLAHLVCSMEFLSIHLSLLESAHFNSLVLGSQQDVCQHHRSDLTAEELLCSVPLIRELMLVWTSWLQAVDVC